MSDDLAERVNELYEAINAGPVRSRSDVEALLRAGLAAAANDAEAVNDDAAHQLALLLKRCRDKRDAEKARANAYAEALRDVLRYQPSVGDGLYVATGVFHTIARAALGDNKV